jgi:outer membrane protein TolC
LLWTEIRQQQSAVEAAQKAYDLEKSRYETGLDPYLDLLTTQTTLLAAQQTLLGLNVEQMTSAVSLIQALGGGWDLTQLPSTQQVTEKPPHDQRTIQQ